MADYDTSLPVLLQQEEEEAFAQEQVHEEETNISYTTPELAGPVDLRTRLEGVWRKVLAFYTQYSPTIILTLLLCTCALAAYFVYCRLGHAHHTTMVHPTTVMPPPPPPTVPVPVV